MVLQLKPCQRNCWAFLRGGSSFNGLSLPTNFLECSASPLGLGFVFFCGAGLKTRARSRSSRARPGNTAKADVQAEAAGCFGSRRLADGCHGAQASANASADYVYFQWFLLLTQMQPRDKIVRIWNATPRHHILRIFRFCVLKEERKKNATTKRLGISQAFSLSKSVRRLRPALCRWARFGVRRSAERGEHADGRPASPWWSWWTGCWEQGLGRTDPSGLL